MTFPRVRLSVRRMMIVVAATGVASWLSATAVYVARDPRGGQMSHLRQYQDTGEIIVETHVLTGDFWPRYWRRLMGHPWPGSFRCSGPGRFKSLDCREFLERLGGRTSTSQSRMSESLDCRRREHRSIV